MRYFILITFLISTFLINAQDIEGSKIRYNALDLSFSGQSITTGFDLDIDLLPDVFDSEFKNTEMINQRIKAYQDFIIPVLIWETQCNPLFVDVPYFRDKDYRVDEFRYYR